MYGPKSQFQNMDRDFGAIYEVREFLVEKYSREKMAALSGKFQWYAPICILRTASGKLFEYKKAIILIREPFEFSRLEKQFEILGQKEKIEGVWLDIIESDHEFDALVSSCLNLELDVVIDPSLDSKGDFRKGGQITPMLVDEEQRNSLVEL
jgi:hypothetical protein